MANEGKEKGTLIKDTMILFIITLIAGFLLGGAYEITTPIIEARKADEKLQAFKNVFEIADSIEENEELDSKAFNSESVLATLGFSGITIGDLKMAVDASGNPMGYVVTVTTTKGYKGNIGITLGYSLEGQVTGLEYLALDETVGLGSKVSEPEFMNHIVGKSASQFNVVKTTSSADGQVQAVSGATVSSNAVVEAVNAGIAFITSEVVGK